MKRLFFILNRIQLTGWVCGLAILLLCNPVFSQGNVNNEKYKVILIGQVTRLDNGAPIKDHEVIISSDSTYEPQFIYTKKLITDHEGFYYDTINFEGLKGALNIQTFDVYEDPHDTTVYFRFNWSTDVILFANFKLPTKPLPVINYQANFVFQNDPAGENNLEYHFTDLTNSSNVISWYWNFGDGTFSSEQNPIHVYDETGVYRVTLTVKIQSPITHKPIISSIVKIINAVNKEYFHLGGMVMADYFPIDKGEAYLYKIENNELVLIDTSYFSDVYGFYYFYQLIEGDYIVKADLSPTSYLFNQFHATYYSNTIHWMDADTIKHHQTNFEYDISMVPVEENMTGSGKIEGLITHSSNSKEKAIPAENVEIILFDNENNTKKICHSNSDGEFSLDLLDLQLYSVYAEVTGKYTFPLNIVLDHNTSEISYIYLTIGNYQVNGSVSSGIDDLNADRLVFGEIYPNPADNNLFLDVQMHEPSSLDYSIMSSSGQLIEEQSVYAPVGSNPLQIDIRQLNSGVYLLRIKENNNIVAARKFFVK
ncbi:MAG: T9SS type A sorting domain-containing protein [Bacteroidales bacterium]|nr:T9SS type A sorting domain-containing protein [Bacteroidales bacterium]